MTTTEGPQVGAGGRTIDPVRLQRRTVLVLMASQIIGGVGVGSALSVGGLIAEELTGSQSWAGMATTMITLGAALFALPLAGIAARRGRRPGLSLGWFVAGTGGAVMIGGAHAGLFAVFLLGAVLFGSGTATNLQSRYAAADLAGERSRGRDLSLVVWATTIGSVAGPNLTGPGAVVAGWLGLSALLGPLVFSTVGLLAAAMLIAVLLRPDPLLAARGLAGGDAAPTAARRGSGPGPWASFGTIARSPGAVLAVVAIVASHACMVMVMTMTPVHMSHGGATLTVIGLTISLHIAGMFALSPLVGWLADRYGRIPMLLAGQTILIAAAAVSGTAGHHQGMVVTGLVLLGVGWSFGLVSASTLLAESLEPHQRPGAQGVSDMAMSLGGAACGALSGVLLGAFGFGVLNAVAIAPAVPVIILALRTLSARSRASAR
ncbi:MFS family permease [Spinactinospora alkalitolerans]|uniref:MFS family permease n=1 Tax=Spinactinospora alkalitolerans TaxID=687207 RepID=A0A852TS59_9ACTN|nr:MFS transporter [Spinactinospora alkalitolerans]NYE46849.1 MFS family permease [Spinactinospora alkalitolerans]